MEVARLNVRESSVLWTCALRRESTIFCPISFTLTWSYISFFVVIIVCIVQYALMVERLVSLHGVLICGLMFVHFCAWRYTQKKRYWQVRLGVRYYTANYPSFMDKNEILVLFIIVSSSCVFNKVTNNNSGDSDRPDIEAVVMMICIWFKPKNEMWELLEQ